MGESSVVTPDGEDEGAGLSESPDVMDQNQKHVEEMLTYKRPITQVLAGLSLAILCSTVIGVELGIIENEGSLLLVCRRVEDDCDENQVYPAGDSGTKFTATNAFRLLTTILVFVRCVYVYKWYHLDLEILKFKGRYPMGGRLRGKKLRTMLFEMGLLAMHPFPFLEGVSTNPYLFVVLLLPALFAGVKLVPRFVYESSKMASGQGRFISAITKVPHTSSFVLRSFLHDSIGLAVVFFLGLSLLVCAYGFRVVESVLCAHDKLVAHCDPVSLTEAMYTIGITMTTIGYGGASVPHTHFGRFIVLLGGLNGLLVTGLFVASLMSLISLNTMEARVVRLLEKHRYRLTQQRAAANVIKVAWYYKKHYSGSLLWRTGRFGLVYRQVSVRVPLEIRVMSRLHRSRLARRLKNTYRLNGHPKLAMEQLLIFLDMHMSDLREYFQEISQIRKYWAEPSSLEDRSIRETPAHGTVNEEDSLIPYAAQLAAPADGSGKGAGVDRAAEAGAGTRAGAVGGGAYVGLRAGEVSTARQIVGSTPLTDWQDQLLASFEDASRSADRVNSKLR